MSGGPQKGSAVCVCPAAFWLQRRQIYICAVNFWATSTESDGNARERIVGENRREEPQVRSPSPFCSVSLHRLQDDDDEEDEQQH